MNSRDSENLRTAASLFVEDRFGCGIQSAFLEVQARTQRPFPSFNPAAQEALRAINHDIWQISVIVSRLEWSRAQVETGILPQAIWCRYAEVDIESLLVQFRSIFDYAARTIEAFAPKRKQLPLSFRSLRENLDKYANRLPEGIEPLIRSADWFDLCVKVRDEIVHGGGHPVVFPSKDEGTLFQVYGGAYQRLIFLRSGMHNENVVRLDRYVAYMFGNTLAFLDMLGKLLMVKCQQPVGNGPTTTYCFG